MAYQLLTSTATPKVAAMTCNDLVQIHSSVRQLLNAIDDFESAQQEQFKDIPVSHMESARNLFHYLAVRQHDLRSLQSQLSRFGLSSLGRMEGRVKGTLETLERVLSALIDRAQNPTIEPDRSALEATSTLARRTHEILGPAPDEREVRVMVTLPTEAASDSQLCLALLQNGMNAARINCAHDGPGDWLAMVHHVRAAASKLGKTCVVLCDLPGPKLRIGAFQPGPRVMKWKPKRDALGKVVEPARLQLVSHANDTCMNTAIPLQVDAAFLALVSLGDVIHFSDARGRKRTLTVTGETPVQLETNQTAYAVPGIELTLRRGDQLVGTGRIQDVPATDVPIVLSADDLLRIERGAVLGRPADGTSEAVVGCELNELFDAVQLDHRILFDDGKIEGSVVKKASDAFWVRIRRAGGGQAKLFADKGINFPDTELELPMLSPKDLTALDFAAQHVDSVGLSFVHTPADIDLVRLELEKRDAGHLGKVLKIETRRAFERLPALLLAGLRHPPLAVMVARGDLGVEVGFERLAEVQEEILWLCEAAHVPVIWATQVLESLTKQGLPSRAEVTDAAMSARAEAVMLNKGPHICESVQFLSDVLQRMQRHQHKKSAQLRRLNVSQL